jgi:coenzyme F420 hydrogenase subunit beta
LTKKTFADLKNEVIDSGLCTRCGSCVGVCPEQAIKIGDPLGEALPVLVGECCDHGACYTSCSGKFVPWPDLTRQVFDIEPDDFMIGEHKSISVGFAADEQVRGNAASGGVVSAISLYLLEKGLVDGIITLVDSEAEPYRAIPSIVTDREGVLSAAQSRYSISPLNTIFNELENLSGVYAYIGLPCQVHSLRKLQAAGTPGINKIKYVIGTYCGNILHFDSVRSFLSRNGVKDLSQVTSLKYRAGDWPGKMQVSLKNGQVFGLEKFYANYLIPFYIMQRCLLCTDLTNEFADISCGDGWSPIYEERGKGWSIALGRTQLGAALLDEMTAEGALELHPIGYEAAVNMHSHGLDLKKRGGFLRIQRRARRGQAVPEYGYELSGAPLPRRIQELVIDLVFFLCGLPLSRRLINLIPVELVGRAFKLLRKVWIKSTRSTKRSGLINTRFNLTGKKTDKFNESDF